MGGGSVLDTGKAVAALIANQRDIFDYLEVVGQGQPLEAEPAPLIAAPTTSGTGAEVSANAVLLSPEHGVKVSLRSPRMIPNAAVVDPELALGVPPAVTAATGMDALTQLLEAYVSPTASPVTSALCLEGLARAAASLRPAFADGSDLTARTDMALAALLSGMALANGKLGAAHGFAAPLGGAFHAPHGAVCAALLPAVMAVNIAALRERRPHSPALERYADVGRVLAGDAAADQDGGAALGVAWVRETCKLLDIPPLSAMGVADADLGDLATKAQRASSMQGNPVELTREELLEILRLAM
jgi:alcohol dehydrogenase class IV